MKYNCTGHCSILNLCSAFLNQQSPKPLLTFKLQFDILKVPDGLENNNQTHLVSHLPMYTSLDYT